MYQSKGRVLPCSCSMPQTKGLPSKPYPLYESKMVKTKQYLFRSSSEFNIFKLEPRQPCFCAIFLCLGAVITGRIRGTKVKPDECLSQSSSIPTQLQKDRRLQVLPHRRAATANCLALVYVLECGPHSKETMSGHRAFNRINLHYAEGVGTTIPD